MSPALLHALDDKVTIHVGDCRDVLQTLPTGSVHCVVTSPPYFGLRDYGVEGQIGLEPTPDEFVAAMVAVFRELRRVLRDDGVAWLNLGDSYNASGRVGHGTRIGAKQGTNRASANGADNTRATDVKLKPKDLLMIPARVALALQADGWWLRSDVIWNKPNPMPESVTDRPSQAHEHIFLLTKSETYFYDADAIKEPTQYQVSEDRAPSGNYSVGSGRGDGGLHRSGGFVTGAWRNCRNVWTITPQPYTEAHFATFPPALPERCIKAGSPKDGVVLDPFGGAGTTGLVAGRLGRRAILIELNPTYAEMARVRIETDWMGPASAAYERAVVKGEIPPPTGGLFDLLVDSGGST